MWAGAALATVISQVASAALCMRQLMLTRENYRLVLREIRFDRNILWQIIRVGLPSGIQNSIISFANVIVQSNVNAFGEMAMAGYGAYSKVEGFGFLPINSFAMALTTFVGQNLGAEQYERTKKGTRFGILATVLLAESIGVLVFIFAPQLIAIFDPTPEVVRFGIEKARTAALFYCLLAFAHAVAAVMRGAGKGHRPDGDYDGDLVRRAGWIFDHYHSLYPQHPDGILGVPPYMGPELYSVFPVL